MVLAYAFAVAQTNMRANEKRARGAANRGLQEITRRYHDGLALTEINDVLMNAGFNALEPAIYCGRDGQAHEQVGPKTWLTLAWHKMESGRYEVVVYLT